MSFSMFDFVVYSKVRNKCSTLNKQASGSPLVGILIFQPLYDASEFKDLAF